MSENNKESVKKNKSEAQDQNDTKENVTNLKDKKTESDDALNQLRTDYLYLKAEFENYKKNNIKERSDLLKYSAERIGLDLLAILDIFEKALENEITRENFQSFVDGVKLISKELRAALEKHGIKEIESLNKPFDPHFHEAMTQVPANHVAPDTVIEVFRKGYSIHDKVLRPSQVVVAKG